MRYISARLKSALCEAGDYRSLSATVNLSLVTRFRLNCHKSLLSSSVLRIIFVIFVRTLIQSLMDSGRAGAGDDSLFLYNLQISFCEG